MRRGRGWVATEPPGVAALRLPGRGSFGPVQVRCAPRPAPARERGSRVRSPQSSILGLPFPVVPGCLLLSSPHPISPTAGPRFSAFSRSPWLGLDLDQMPGRLRLPQRFARLGLFSALCVLEAA